MEDNAVSPEIYELLASADWEDLGKKMLGRAIWRGSTRYRITKMTIFARGCSIEDVVSHIIESAFDGRRKWDPTKKDLENWLLNHVDSVMDWWLKLRENRDLAYDEFESIEQSTDDGATQVQSIELEAVLRYGPLDPATITENINDEDQAKELYNTLFDSTADDPELQDVILVMIDMNTDFPKPADIAEKLGVSVDEIYNRKKRLKRCLDKVVASLEKKRLS